MESVAANQTALPEYSQNKYNNATNMTNATCRICKQSHHVRNCPRFRNLRFEEKWATIKREGICSNCLASSHTSANCKGNGRCLNCGQRHHTLLHNTNHSHSNHSTLPSGQLHTFTQRYEQNNITLRNQKEDVTKIPTYQLSNVLLATAVVKLRAPSELLPTREVSPKSWSQLQNLSLADPHFYRPGEIDILIGSDIYGMIILPGLRKGKRGTPVAQNTELGWIVSEQANEESSKSTTIVSLHQSVTQSNQLKPFWELEEVQGKQVLSPEDEQCEHHNRKHVNCDEHCRYKVAQTLSSSKPLLGSSKPAGFPRFLQMEAKFQKGQKYCEYMARLQQRPKWLTKQKQPTIGEIVLIRDERSPPLNWPLAKIVAVHPGSDGLIRVVTVHTQNGTYKRPMSKIAVLSVQDEVETK